MTHILIARWVLILGSVLVLGWAAPQSTPRPFRGQVQGTIGAIPTANPARWTSHGSASGHGSHVGAFTADLSGVIIILSPVQCLFNGVFTMTSANGDRLAGSCF